MSEALFDPEAVRAFEHAGWQQVAPDYDATFAQATAEFVEALLNACAAGNRMRILDLCCGTGIVTAAAAARGAVPTGFDFSPAMLAQARRAHPNLRFDQGDAEALSYPDGAFDAVVSNFGIHHIPRPEFAVREAYRALCPGGRFAFTSWAVRAENIPWGLLFDAIRVYGDPDAASRTPPSGGSLDSSEAALRLLQGAGFIDAAAETIRREWHLPSAAVLVAALRRGTVRTAALIAAQPGEAMPAITAAIERDMSEYRRGDGFAVPIVAILASGTKSAE